jgi:hypothetical protein
MGGVGMNSAQPRGSGGVMLRTLLLVALCGLVSGAAAASRFHERNHSGLLFLYTFDEGQRSASPPSEIRDVSDLNLMGNLTTSTNGAVSWDVAQQGMRIPSIAGGARAVGQRDISAILPLMSSEFTIEIWLRTPINPNSVNQFVVGFGGRPETTPYYECVLDGGWQLITGLGSTLHFITHILVDGVPTCQHLTVSVSTNVPQLITLRMRDGLLMMLRNYAGASGGAYDGYSFSPPLWQYTTPLNIATPTSSNGWTGTIYMIAMYDRFLSNAEVNAHWQYGPPNSFPYGAGAVEVDEDVSVPLVVASA